MEGVELIKSSSTGSADSETLVNKSASVVISGMRGSGKTYIGELAAACLEWSFVDADAFFEEKHKVGVREFVHQHGWPAFREAETELLKVLLTDHSTKHVISLGGGIVETVAARDLLQAYAKTGPVVHIVRDLEEIIQYLGEEAARPAYGEPVEDVYRRREPWFVQCCSYEFVNHTRSFQKSTDQDAPPKPNDVREEVNRFFKHVTGQHPNLAPNLAKGKRSYFLSLTYPDIT